MGPTCDDCAEVFPSPGLEQQRQHNAGEAVDQNGAPVPHEVAAQAGDGLAALRTKRFSMNAGIESG